VLLGRADCEKQTTEIAWRAWSKVRAYRAPIGNLNNSNNKGCNDNCINIGQADLNELNKWIARNC
jgi:hypothetical protein